MVYLLMFLSVLGLIYFCRLLVSFISFFRSKFVDSDCSDSSEHLNQA